MARGSFSGDIIKLLGGYNIGEEFFRCCLWLRYCIFTYEPFSLYCGRVSWGLLLVPSEGIGAVAGCSLLLPITYSINPTAAIIMLAGIYYGNMYGGAYSAIMLNIPGDSPAVITALEVTP